MRYTGYQAIHAGCWLACIFGHLNCVQQHGTDIRKNYPSMVVQRGHSFDGSIDSGMESFILELEWNLNGSKPIEWN